jgi:peptidylprolyl isomerase
MSLPFWSTKDAGQKPFSFTIGQGSVIKAWDEGVLTMSLGERARISASADYAVRSTYAPS